MSFILQRTLLNLSNCNYFKETINLNIELRTYFMMASANPREVLFRVGTREIVRNGLYVIAGPGAPDRDMAVSYDLNTNESTWVHPTGERFYADGRGLMATVINIDLFEDAFDTPKPYLRFKGGEISFDDSYRPTQEHIRILQNWHAELHNAGIGGMAPDLTIDKIKPEFRKYFKFE